MTGRAAVSWIEAMTELHKQLASAATPARHMPGGAQLAPVGGFLVKRALVVPDEGLRVVDAEHGRSIALN